MDKKSLAVVRKIIITADDYGMSRVYNNTIEGLVGEGIVSSVSVMVTREEGQTLEGFRKLAENARLNNVTLGLHFEAKIGDNYIFKLEQQLDKFISLICCNPDYIDIHAPHKIDKDVDTVWKLISGKGWPIRNMGQRLADTITTDSEVFIATGLAEHEILKWLCEIGSGVHEIVFHPGVYDPNCRSTLNEKRSYEAQLARRTKFLVDYMPNMEVCNYNIFKQ